MKFLELEEYGDLSGTVFVGDMYLLFVGLTSLEGMPTKIIGNLLCWGNNLTTLEGMPKIIDGDCLITNNQLSSLKGISKLVTGDFDCCNNNLTILDYFPNGILGHFSCSENTNKYLQEEFFFRRDNPNLSDIVFKIRMFEQTKCEYYITLKEYEDYIEEHPEYAF